MTSNSADHLLVASWCAVSAVDLDDVAKLARERTAARVLHGHATVFLQFTNPKSAIGAVTSAGARRFVVRFASRARGL
jgi:hypothetical protein